jgi:hypothetical protein
MTKPATPPALPADPEPSMETIMASIRRISDAVPTEEPSNAEILASLKRLQRTVDAIVAHLGMTKPVE